MDNELASADIERGGPARLAAKAQATAPRASDRTRFRSSRPSFATDQSPKASYSVALNRIKLLYFALSCSNSHLGADKMFLGEHSAIMAYPVPQADAVDRRFAVPWHRTRPPCPPTVAAIAPGARLPAAPARWISSRPMRMVDTLDSAGIARGCPARACSPGHIGGHRAQGHGDRTRYCSCRRHRRGGSPAGRRCWSTSWPASASSAATLPAPAARDTPGATSPKAAAIAPGTAAAGGASNMDLLQDDAQEVSKKNPP